MTVAAIDKLQLADLDEEQRQLAELIGIDNYIKLIKTYGGLQLYVPKAHYYELADRNRRINDEYNGYNAKLIAQKYGIAENTVYVIVRDKLQRLRERQLEGQISFEHRA